MSLIEDDKKKPKEEIKGVFITLALRKTSLIDDIKTCTNMFEKVKQQLENKIHLKKIQEYFVIMEFGKTADKPHIHIVMMFKKPLNHTQIGRIIKYPVKRILNPLSYDSGDGKDSKWCKTKICGNKSYLYQKYLKKESKDKRCITCQYNIDWIQAKKVNDAWLNDNLHKKILKLKYISKNTLPNRIIDYADWKQLPVNTLEQYVHIIEIMYRDKYNMSTLYMSNSLMKQTYNCIQVLKGNKINYSHDYYINVDKTKKQLKMDMTIDRLVVSKTSVDRLKYVIKTL